MEQTKHKSAAKVLIVAVCTFILTFAMAFAILPAMTLTAYAADEDDITFTKVTDASQITAENIGTCTAEEAKAWILANWNDVNEGSVADIAFYSNTGELNIVGFNCGENKEVFSNHFNGYINTTYSISNLQEWFGSGDSVFICTAPTYAQYKNTTTVIKFDDKDWYLIDYDDDTVTLLSKECVGASRFGSENTYAGSTVETAVNNYYAESISTGAKTAVSNNNMFLLSTDEAKIIYNANPDVLKCSMASGADDNVWWLCSQGYDYYYAAVVDGEDGEVDEDGYNLSYEYGVRPALKLDLSKVEFDSETKTFAVPTPTHTHNYSTDWSSDASTHWHACTAEGECDAPKADEAAHSYAEAMTDTTYYTCSVCSYVDNDRKAAYDLADAKTTATNTVNGVNANDYITADQDTVTNAKTTALAAIEAAMTEDEVTAAMTTFNNAIAACTTQAAADQAAANAVSDAINALPAAADITLDNAQAVADAKAAYDALTADQKALVPAETVNKLNAAVAKIADLTAANAVKALIAAIGEVTYTTESKGKIDAAREAYDALTADQKALVDNYATLTTAETTYATEKKTADDNAAANTVKEKIAAIGEVAYTTESKGKIDAAREAYDALTADQKALVTNYTDLTTAESSYNTLKADNDAADEVKALIAAIGEVAYTTESKGKIDAAREAYDALTADQKALVDNYATLTTAETTYAAEKKTADDNAAANAVKEKIAAIGTVEYTTESKGKIDEAREAYDALTADQKALVDNYATLTTAESTYATLKADNDAADEVKALIAAIGEVTYTTESKGKIDAAREAYDALTADQKALVTNYTDLTTAESSYNTLKADNDAADEVKALIAAIGEVTYPGSKDAVKAAKDAFDALTDEQKALVDDEHKDALADAEAAYKALEDAAKADEVKALIDAIGEVEDTDETKDAIDAAKEAYDALTDDQKALITEDAPTIVTAEATYTTLHNNNLAAAEVVALINAIGTVEYTETSKGKIDAAKVAYNGLTDAQKAIVDSYLTENEVETIVVSETIYFGLGDQQRAQEVKDLIVAIGEVTFPGSKDKIEAAREGYDGLTDAQKPLVDNYETLTTAETTYAGLKAQANKKLSGGAIAGIVIGCVAFVAIVCFLLWFFLFKKKKEDKDEPIVAVLETNDEPQDDQTDEPKDDQADEPQDDQTDEPKE